jgi:uncharacterized protein YjiS (DUF1127 family)
MSLFIRPVATARPHAGSPCAAWWRALSVQVDLAAIWAAIDRGRQRRALGELDERLLRDVGLTRAEARRECAKPFWRR